jgi:predicted PurR-regulated permease PerM
VVKSLSHELKAILVVLGTGVILIIGLKFLFPMVAPFLLGITFACLSEPFVKWCTTRLSFSRRFSISLVIAALVLLVLGITVITVLALYQEAQRILPNVPELVKRLTFLDQCCRSYLNRHFHMFEKNYSGFALDLESISQIFKGLLGGIFVFLRKLPQLLLAISFGGISAYFISRDKEELSRFFYKILPENWRGVIIGFKEEFLGTISRFIRAECVLVFITVLITGVGLKIIGIPGYLAYGLMATGSRLSILLPGATRSGLIRPSIAVGPREL